MHELAGIIEISFEGELIKVKLKKLYSYSFRNLETLIKWIIVKSAN
jgi:hypothetical protein